MAGGVGGHLRHSLADVDEEAAQLLEGGRLGALAVAQVQGGA